jgi:carboxypeptidase PM20D1
MSCRSKRARKGNGRILHFPGAIADGFIWGRGTLDDKSSVAGILEAVNNLLAKGFQPKRTVYLAFGQDEEIRGSEGAEKVADLLKTRGKVFEFVLDEGYATPRKHGYSQCGCNRRDIGMGEQ